MLVNLKEILAMAEADGSAVGSFNAPNLPSLHAILAAAEEANRPVILMHAQIHEEMGLTDLEEISPILLRAADKAKVPVCVHLDHGTDMEYVKRGIALGYTSVMYDGSELTEDKNLKNTGTIVELAHKAGVSVEAEIGSMGAREGGGASDREALYTDPMTAKSFAEKTGIDALACAFGTAHGLYTEAPKLDFERVEKIRNLTGLPLVMHGGSGVSDADFRRAIRCGIRKINYYTYMAKAGSDALRDVKIPAMYHDLEKIAEAAMKTNVLIALKIFEGSTL